MKRLRKANRPTKTSTADSLTHHQVNHTNKSASAIRTLTAKSHYRADLDDFAIARWVQCLMLCMWCVAYVRYMWGVCVVQYVVRTVVVYVGECFFEKYIFLRCYKIGLVWNRIYHATFRDLATLQPGIGHKLKKYFWCIANFAW